MKAWNKKLANNKTDTRVELNQKRTEIERVMVDIKQNMVDFEV